MSTTKKLIEKTVKTSTVKNATKKDKVAKKIEAVNIGATLDKFADKLNNKKIVEKTKKDTIYIYPENLSASDINSEKGKTFRNSLRNKLKRLSNNIFVFAKTKQEEKLISEVKMFNSFYKENYIKNDFTLSSISQSKNGEKTEDMQLMLNIVQDVNNMK